MYKIAICGKANSGKDTVSKFIIRELRNKLKGKKSVRCQYIAFADPIKAMIRLMFPTLPEKYITGSSQYRSSVIPGAFFKGQPLTVRQLHTDLGTEVGRAYSKTIWLDVFDHTFEKASNKDVVIVTDVRFRNEFDHLKKLGFYQIRLLRGGPVETPIKSSHSSEVEQDTIKDDEFDFVLNNNGTLKDLKSEVSKIISQIKF
jgi:hypothetical protein